MSLVEVAAIQDVVGNSVTWLAAIQDEVRSIISRGGCDTRRGAQCQ